MWAEANWAKWPHLTISADCGSDGLCALFAMEYGWGFNIDRLPDLAHAANCDFHGALQDRPPVALFLLRSRGEG